MKKKPKKKSYILPLPTPQEMVKLPIQEAQAAQAEAFLRKAIVQVQLLRWRLLELRVQAVRALNAAESPRQAKRSKR